MPATRLRLGTRRSALAWIQSTQVARAISRLHPDVEVELVGIDTRGDRIQDVPLSGVEGKEFFTAEIDQALIEGRVDITVHSLKDLSVERPAALCTAAIPVRANPRDIALFAPDVPERLSAGAGLRIGSSSPRRQELLPPFLRRALPHASRNSLSLESLRGNVDTRLRRLREPRGSERHLDGIVLALAGLTRLFADTETDRRGHALMQELLSELNLMLLPLSENPAAPGQGALAIECRSDDALTRAILATMDDAATRRAVISERALLREWGGGCHQRFGATQVAIPGVGALLYVAGRRDTGEPVALHRWWPDYALPVAPRDARAWDGSQQPAPQFEYLLDAPALGAKLRDAPAVFVAHWRALPPDAAAHLHGRRVWTSGTTSWERLAQQGVWVEGSAEGLGVEALAPTLAEPVLGLPKASEWSVLTHADATDSWSAREVIGSYRLEPHDFADEAAMRKATHVYWTSVAQYERGKSLLRHDVQHATGPGKTAAHLHTAGIANLRAFPSVDEWRKWLGAE
ncbi:MAG: hydroxymethylbilane synthase [Steroidobacteraceae bacterium]